MGGQVNGCARKRQNIDCGGPQSNTQIEQHNNNKTRKEEKVIIRGVKESVLYHSCWGEQKNCQMLQQWFWFDIRLMDFYGFSTSFCVLRISFSPSISQQFFSVEESNSHSFLILVSYVSSTSSFQRTNDLWHVEWSDLISTDSFLL